MSPLSVPHLFTAVVVLALLLPLPMLLSHWMLTASAWIYCTPLREANGHTCPGEGQICRPVTLSTSQAPGCQSVLIAANTWATRYSKTLWEHAQINLRDEQIGCPNTSECIITAQVQQVLLRNVNKGGKTIKYKCEISTERGAHRRTKIAKSHIMLWTWDKKKKM